MKKLLISITFFTFLLTSNKSIAQDIKSGNWEGKIQYDSVTVPFNFEVSDSDDRLSITIINCDEEIKLTNISTRNDSLFIPLGVFDAQLVVKTGENEMNGYWQKNYRDSKEEFRAYYNKERFNKNKASSTQVTKKWQMTFKPGEMSAYQGIGLWKHEGNKVKGTIMTGVSDFRYFEGVVYGDSLIASSFDGAHAFLIKGKKQDDKWTGKFHFDNGYAEEWIAQTDDNAAIEPQYTTIKPKTHRPFYDILAAGSGGVGAIDESKYFNKVLIIQLFGTWCPNSWDATRFLKEWYADNRDKDVEILAATYEPNFSQEYGQERIEAYRNNLDIEYDIVLGGRLSKSQAALAFPFMSKIEAFPTLIIVDKDGFVHSVFNYFNGPATGEYYEAFKIQFEEVIERLLAE